MLVDWWEGSTTEIRFQLSLSRAIAHERRRPPARAGAPGLDQKRAGKRQRGREWVLCCILLGC